MNMKYLLIILASLLFVVSCKDEDDTSGSIDYKKFTIVCSDMYASNGVDSLVIELNNNLTIKSIKEYTLLGSDTVVHILEQEFLYSAGSAKIDSSVITVNDWLAGISTHTEKYVYNGERIARIISPYLDPTSIDDTLDFTYDSEGRITKVREAYFYHQAIIESNYLFTYSGNNLSSAAPGNTYSGFDNKINPLNYIYKHSKFPIYQARYHMFAREYSFSENNPTAYRLKVNQFQFIDQTQTYTYNAYNYPTEIKSLWGYYNIRFYYE